MKKNKIIQAKAAFLMLVFSFNTLLGFACSLGFDMGYNKRHHEETTKTSVQNSCHHKEPTRHQHSKQSSNSSKDDCCSNGVTSFNLLNKTVPKAFTFPPPVFGTAFVAAFLQTALLPQNDLLKDIRAFSQSYHPPIPDIRIAIKSFLI